MYTCIYKGPMTVIWEVTVTTTMTMKKKKKKIKKQTKFPKPQQPLGVESLSQWHLRVPLTRPRRPGGAH